MCPSGLPECNFTQTPNEFFDYWCAILSPAEYKVFSILLRKTYGWRQTNNSIGLNDLVKLTNLSKNGVIQSLQALINYGLVEKSKNFSEEKGHLPNNYQVHIIDTPIPLSGVPYTTEWLPPSALSELGSSEEKESNTKKKNIYKEKEKNSSRNARVQPCYSFLGSHSNVKLTQDQINALKTKFNQDYDMAIEIFGEWLLSSGQVKRSHYKCILNWVADAIQNKKLKDQKKVEYTQKTSNEDAILKELMNYYTEWITTTSDPFYVNMGSIVIQDGFLKKFGSDYTICKASVDKLMEVLKNGHYIKDYVEENMLKIIEKHRNSLPKDTI